LETQLTNAQWRQKCEHRWDRWSDEPNMVDELGPPSQSSKFGFVVPGLSATVEIAPKHVARLPGFKGKWVHTCWALAECCAWVGPFETAQEAMKACDAHIESGHLLEGWPGEA
jgi:hypothetical protein